MTDNLHFIKELGKQSQKALEAGDLEEFARLMDLHWQRKKERSKGMSNDNINSWYDSAMANGALGCTISGAGPSMFAWSLDADAPRVRDAMVAAFKAAGKDTDAWIVPISSTGAHVVV